MTTIVLVHQDAPGAQSRAHLDRYDLISTYFLPDNLQPDCPWNASKTPDETHTIARIDVADGYATLSVHVATDEPVVLLTGNQEIEIPISSVTVQRSIILRPGEWFTTSAGRWTVKWDIAGNALHWTRPPLLTISEDTIDGEEMYGDIPFDPCIKHTIDDKDCTSDGEQSNPVLRQILVENNIPRCTTSTMAIEEHKSHLAVRSELTSGMSSGTPKGPVSPNNRTEDKEGEARTCETYNAMNIRDTDHFKACRGDSQVFSIEINMQISDHNRTSIQSAASDDLEKVQTPIAEQTPNASENGGLDQDVKKSTKRRFGLTDIEENHESASQKQRAIMRCFRDTREGCKPLSISLLPDSSPERSQERHPEVYLPMQSISASVRLESGTPCKLSAASVTESPTPTRKSARPFSSMSMLASQTSASDHPSGGLLRPVVVFSSTSKAWKKKTIMNTFKKLGGIVTDDIERANLLCVGKGSLKKTSKLVIAVLSGKDIVHDQWLEETHARQKFANPEPYLPVDHARELEWKFDLGSAIRRGREGLKLLDGFDVFITQQLQTELGKLRSDVKQVALRMGARKVGLKLPTMKNEQSAMLIVGSPGSDEDHGKVSKLQMRMYNKDVLIMAALRGRLDLASDEFVIRTPTKNEPDD